MPDDEKTFTIEWLRQGETEPNRCSGLTPRVALARLMGGLETTGAPITIVSITRDYDPSESKK